MLRLANLDATQVKESLKYVEMQLAQSRHQLQKRNEEYEALQLDVQKAREEIDKQSTLNHC